MHRAIQSLVQKRKGILREQYRKEPIQYNLTPNQHSIDYNPNIQWRFANTDHTQSYVVAINEVLALP